MEHTKLIEYLAREIDYLQRHDEDFNVCSWPLEKGVLISGNDAKIVAELANHHAHLVDALEGMVDTFKQFRDHSNRCGDALNDAEELLNNLKTI